MFFALTRGVPEAGVAFAAAMVVGVGVTLAAVAVLAILGRQWLVGLLLRHGASLSRLAQGLDAASGTLLVVIGIGAFLR